MNSQERRERFEERLFFAIFKKAACDKSARRWVRDEFSSARRTATLKSRLKRWREFAAQETSKYYLRLAPTSEVQLHGYLQEALRAFRHQPAVLRDFMCDLGQVLSRGPKRKQTDRINQLILKVWDGFDILPATNRNAKAFFRTLPPLSRWNDQAAWQVIKMQVREGEGALSYETYRKRIERLGLRQEKPVLLKKITMGANAFTLTYTPEGMQWLRENDVLGAVTGNGKKMSHDRSMGAALNGRQWTKLNQRRAIAVQKLPP